MREAAPQLFDTHVHLDAPPLGAGLGAVLQSARQAGVSRFLIPGVERSGWPGILAIAREQTGVFAAPGMHPLAAGEWCSEAAGELEALLADPAVAAVGEIGLDALIPAPSPERQEEVFRAQLRLAVAARRPVLLHCRRATDRLLRILREEKAERVGGILHAFGGSLETAQAAIRLGFVIGIGGSVTYLNARRLLEVVQALPDEALVLETDAPDLAPHPHRGEVNRPAWLPLVARRVAQLRGWSEEETARITTANAMRVLHIRGS